MPPRVLQKSIATCANGWAKKNELFDITVHGESNLTALGDTAEPALPVVSFITSPVISVLMNENGCVKFGHRECGQRMSTPSNGSIGAFARGWN
jgi:hypothetical protein